MTVQSGAVIALAGRRVDAPGATARFPLAHVDTVRRRLRELFTTLRPSALVCSAACGADLIALDLAAELGIPLHIVLPFPRSEFRDTSVTDRPGEWGPMFDRLMDEVERRGSVTVLDGAASGDAAYIEATRAIVTVAQRQASQHPPVAIVVWDGHPRGSTDITASFATMARAAGMDVVEVPTL